MLTYRNRTFYNVSPFLEHVLNISRFKYSVWRIILILSSCNARARAHTHINLRRKILWKLFSFALAKSWSRNGWITLRSVRISSLATTFPSSSSNRAIFPLAFTIFLAVEFESTAIKILLFSSVIALRSFEIVKFNDRSKILLGWVIDTWYRFS